MDVYGGTSQHVTPVEVPDATIVRLYCAINLTMRDDARSSVSENAARRLPIVDSGDITFVDSGGLAFLMLCRRMAREHGLCVSLPDRSGRGDLAEG